MTRCHVFLTAALLAVLTGCNLLPRVPETVRVPVPVSCLRGVDIPARPELAQDADLLSMDDRAFVLALVRDRDRLIGYTGELEALIGPCR